MLETLDVTSVRAWAKAAAESLEQQRHQIDALNVFPVADTDTGTNLAVTMRAGSDAVLGALSHRSAGEAVSALARGMARSARGNSGVILAELLRGLAEAIVAGTGSALTCDAALFRQALDRAASFAYAAVGQPVEGTMLSVVRAAERATRTLPADAGLGVVVCAARDGAVVALANTPAQLAVLADAGVVDAGGTGLVVVLDALCAVVTGESGSLGGRLAGDGVGWALTGPISARPAARAGADDQGHPGYEVQYLIEATADAIATLRASLSAIGDSVTIAGIEADQWNVHVHADDAGAAIEAGLAIGRPREISVTRFADSPRLEQSEVAGLLVALPNPDLAPLFDSMEVAAVVIDTAAGEATLRAAVLSAAARAPSSRCIVLPTDQRLIELSARVVGPIREQGVDVSVVPCRSPLQAIAAIAVHDDARQGEDDAIAMAEAAAATRFARIEVASGAGLTTIGPCRAGDILGLIDEDVVEIGDSVVGVTIAVVDRLLGIGGELMTAIVGAASADMLPDPIRSHVADRAPFVELTLHQVDALDCLALFGME